jgi:hypothetical protein
LANHPAQQYDTQGNVVESQSFDPKGTLTVRRNMVYDDAGMVTEEWGRGPDNGASCTMFIPMIAVRSGRPGQLFMRMDRWRSRLPCWIRRSYPIGSRVGHSQNLAVSFPWIPDRKSKKVGVTTATAVSNALNPRSWTIINEIPVASSHTMRQPTQSRCHLRV